MGKKKKKIPFTQIKESIEKKPRGLSLGDKVRGNFVSWNIGSLDKDGPFGWNSLSPDIFWEHIKTRLSEFEKLTWDEIYQRDSSHPIKKEALCPSAQQRLAKIEMDDLDELVSLGITNTARIFGIRNGSKLFVLWWDPNHRVCPSHKKNT